MQKRGISPLLASVIVIGIVIAVAAVVFLWGKQLTENIAEKEGEISTLELSCSNVKIDVTDTSQGSVKVQNNGQLIDGVILVVKGGGSSANTVFDDSIEEGSERSFPYEGFPDVPDVEQVTVIPALGKGIYRPCSGQKVDVTL